MAKIRIKEVLAARGMTQKELAQECGISVVAMSRLLNGEENGRSMNLSTLERIAAALKIPVYELFDKPAGIRCNCPECGSSMRLIVRKHGK